MRLSVYNRRSKRDRFLAYLGTWTIFRRPGRWELDPLEEYFASLGIPAEVQQTRRRLSD